MWGKVRLGLLLGGCLLTGCVSAQRHDSLKTRYDEAEASNRRLTLRVNQLEGEKQELDAQSSDAHQRIKQLSVLRSKDQEVAGKAITDLKARHAKQMAQAQSRQAGLSKKLEQAMRNLARTKGIDYEPGSGRLKLSAQVLFEPGQSEIRASGRKALLALASALAGGPERLRIEGHTDADPVRKTRTRWQHGNWELSGNRSLQVLAFLEQNNVSGIRMQFVGRGPYLPIASNLTESGKRANRRVEIFILPAPLDMAGIKK